MKKLIVFTLCIMLVLSMLSCGAKNEELTDKRIENCIDTASLDIDSDGVFENCSMMYGPTSGLFTVVITASAEGKIKYRNTFNL